MANRSDSFIHKRAPTSHFTYTLWRVRLNVSELLYNLYTLLSYRFNRMCSRPQYKQHMCLETRLHDDGGKNTYILQAISAFPQYTSSWLVGACAVGFPQRARCVHSAYIKFSASGVAALNHRFMCDLFGVFFGQVTYVCDICDVSCLMSADRTDESGW